MTRELTVQIQWPSGGFGSGTLVGPGLILTALHVVFPTGKGETRPDRVPADPACPEVRLVADFDAALEAAGYRGNFDHSKINVERIANLPGTEFHPCELVWPRPGDDMPAVDVALLRMRDDAMAVSANAARVGPFAMGRAIGRETTLEGRGFPAFTEISAGANQNSFSDIYHLWGRSKGTTGLLRRTPYLDVLSAQPATAQDWSGLSGTALWEMQNGSQPRLVGVISEAEAETRRNDQLYFTCLSQLSGIQGFWQAFGRGFAEAPARSTADDLKHRLIHFDRTLQRADLQQWLIAPPPAARPRALVVPIAGHVVDEPTFFVDTALELMEKHAGLSLGSDAPRALVGVQPASDPQKAVRAVYLDWAQKLGLDTTQEPDANSLARMLEDVTRAQVLVLEHSSSVITPTCEAVIEAVLSVFDRVRPEERGDHPPPVLFLSVSLGTKKGKIDSAYLPAQLFDEKALGMQTCLTRIQDGHPRLAWAEPLVLHETRCIPTHMSAWLDDLEPLGLEITDDARDALEEGCEDFDQYPLRYAQKLLDKVIKDGVLT